MSERFDDLARMLADPMPRGRALKLMGGALVGGVLALCSPRAAEAGGRGCPEPRICSPKGGPTECCRFNRVCTGDGCCRPGRVCRGPEQAGVGPRGSFTPQCCRFGEVCTVDGCCRRGEVCQASEGLVCCPPPFSCQPGVGCFNP